MSGHWPPEWEDPEDIPEEADRLDATEPASGDEARLSEVAAYLASVPAPAMPDAVAAGISAALAAEAATRVVTTGQHDDAGNAAPGTERTQGTEGTQRTEGTQGTQGAQPSGARTLESAPARARLRRHRGSHGRRRDFRMRPAMAAGSLIVFLVLAGLGYGLSLISGTASSSSAGSSAASSATSASGGNISSASSAAGAAAPAASARTAPRIASPSAAFEVTKSGTTYQRATLAGQVRARLAASGAEETSRASAPAPGAATAGATPSSALLGCVTRLTGGTLPRLVDRATYQGEPAYIIATPSRVWVVRLGCTAAKPELIVSVPLAGLPGISAL